MVFPRAGFVTARIACTVAVVVCQNEALGNGRVTFDTQPLIITHLGFRLTDKASLTEMGVSQDHVRLLARHGVIKAVKLGHDWIVLDLSYTRKRRPKGGAK